ncbi:Hypothetical protein NTJ_08199 [Nesidiocoris tenuis]|nr:Hypothetical protein NTJ_08199 [Nesidiocoris tenuis]
MFCRVGENIVPKLKISLKHLSSTNEANPSLDSAGSKHLDDDISEKENFPVDIEDSKIDLCLSLPFKRSSSPILDSPPMKKIDLSLVKFLDLKTGDLTTTFIKSEDSAKNSAFSDSFFNMAMPDVNLNYKVPTAVSAGGELNLKSLNCSEFEARPSLMVTMKKVDSWENLLCNICSCTFPNVQEWTCHYSEGCTSAVTDHRLSPNRNLNPVF